MRSWQLSIAVRCGWVARVEVLALRCCGYQVRVILRTGRVRVSWLCAWRAAVACAGAAQNAFASLRGAPGFTATAGKSR